MSLLPFFCCLSRLFFLLSASLVASQSTNPKSKSDQVCISGSISPSIDGTYKYFSWDLNTNGSIYYNSLKKQYLYPLIYSSNNKDYLISTDPLNFESSSYCHLPDNKNIFNPDECFNSYDGQWISYHNQSKQWLIDTDLRLVNCNDICVYNSNNNDINGIYKWLHFDKTLRCSIYHCQQCILSEHPYLNVYLYGYNMNDTPHWIIGTDYTQSHPLSACILSNYEDTTDYIFNLDDCNIWSTQTKDVFTDDMNMMVQKCTDSVDRTPTKYHTMNPTVQGIENNNSIKYTSLNPLTTIINDKSNRIIISEDMLLFIIIVIAITVLTFICCIICCVILYKYWKNKKSEIGGKQNEELDIQNIPNINEKKLTPPGYAGFGGRSISSKGYISIKNGNYYSSEDEGVKKQIRIQFDEDDDGAYDGIVNDDFLNEALNDVLRMPSIAEIKINQDIDSDSDDLYNDNNINESDSEEMYDNPDNFQTASTRKTAGDV